MRSSGIRLASLLAASASMAGMGQFVYVGDPGQSATTPSVKQQPAQRVATKKRKKIGCEVSNNSK